MKIKEAITYGTIIVAVLGTTYAFADRFGFRPALKIEVDEVKQDVELVGQSVRWLRLEWFERRIRRGLPLSRQQCAEYRRLARSLGVQPLVC